MTTATIVHVIGSSPAPGAVPRWHPLPGLDGRRLQACLLEFDPNRFDPGAFVDHAIELPSSVARSVRKRQAEFFHGRLAARIALQAAGFADAVVAIGAEREPVWPPGVVGSISHGHRLAASVVASAADVRGIGIDIETVIADDTRAALLSGVIDHDEFALLQAAHGGLPLNTCMTLAFSAKESLFKGAFRSVGRFFDFSAARLVMFDPAARRLQLRLTETLADEFRCGQRCSIHCELLPGDRVLTSFVC